MVRDGFNRKGVVVPVRVYEKRYPVGCQIRIAKCWTSDSKRKEKKSPYGIIDKECEWQPPYEGAIAREKRQISWTRIPRFCLALSK